MVPSEFDTTKCRFTDGIFGIQLFASALSDPHQQILNYSSSNTNLELIERAKDIRLQSNPLKIIDPWKFLRF